MRSLIQRILKIDFFRNLATLVTGNVIAQLIGFGATIILSRLYSPEEFGQVALFVSIVNVLAIAANARYDMAIVLPRRNSKAFHLLVGSMGITALFTLLLFFIIAIFQKSIVAVFEAPVFSQIVWLIPVLVFLLATHKSMHFWFNRQKNYKTIAHNRIILSASQSGIKLPKFLYSDGNWGLIIGTVLGQLIAVVVYLRRIIRESAWRLRYFSFRSMRKSFVEYANFPKYLLPQAVLNTFSVNILIFSLSAIASSTVVGFYERANRVISMPFSLLSTSFGNVFYEQMTRTQNPKKFYLTSYFANLGIATVVLIPIMLWGEAIFAFVLGKEWWEAGAIARLIAPFTIFQFATASVSNTFSVYKKNQLSLIWQIFYLVIAVSWLFLARLLDVYLLIRIYAYIAATLYAVLAYMGYRVVDREDRRINEL